MAIHDPLRHLPGAGVVFISEDDRTAEEDLARMEQLHALGSGRGRNFASKRAMVHTAAYLRARGTDMPIGIGNRCTPGWGKPALDAPGKGGPELSDLCRSLRAAGIECDDLEDVRNLVRCVRRLMKQGLL